jgi:hypothetical protein
VEREAIVVVNNDVGERRRIAVMERTYVTGGAARASGEAAA